MTELELITRVTPTLPTNPSVVIGPGDDCAALDLGLADNLVLFKTDAVVEGVHFLGETDPEKIGHKALARCLSDIAAMGGHPTHALVTIGLPSGFDAAFVDAIYAGINALARRYAVAIAGGKTTSSPNRVFLSISALGTVRKDRCILRSGARVGDAIFVTGTLGGSLAGKHLDFEPRLLEAQWLTAHFQIHAMIDISDGLAGDLRHLVTANQIGAEILTSAIPISSAARKAAKRTAPKHGADADQPQRPNPPLVSALTDGEDFELMFALASKDAVRLLDAWKARFPETPLSCIGKFVNEPGVRLRDRNGIRPLKENGYVHFT